jgi:hypothetical protein
MRPFLVELEEFIAELTRFLSEAEAADDKPTAAAPDSELLKKLADACSEYRMDEIDEIIGELEQFKYDDGDSLIQWIKSKIAEGEFEEVLAKVA